MLRRLSVFAGAFTLDAACAIGTDAAASAPEVAEIVADLVAKSLLQADANISVRRYRMLETTRAYVEEKVAQSGELEDVARRYAEYIASPSEPPIAVHRLQLRPGGAWAGQGAERGGDIAHAAPFKPPFPSWPGSSRPSTRRPFPAGPEDVPAA